MGDNEAGDGSVLTEEESALIDRLREGGVSAKDVEVEKPGAPPPKPAAAPSGLTQADLDATLEARDGKRRIALAQEHFSAHIGEVLQNHEGTKGFTEKRLNLSKALVWDEFATANPDSKNMTQAQIDEALTVAATKVAEEEAALRKGGSGSPAAAEADRRLAAQNKSGEGASGGSARSAGAAGGSAASDPARGSGKLDRPTLGVNASTDWHATDDALLAATEEEGKELYKAIQEGRVTVPAVPDATAVS